MIKISKINKFFNKGKPNELHVLNDISLELPESGMISIFGKSGCGKTTLLNVIGGLDSFANGNITVMDNSITKDTDMLRNKYIGYIFQNYNLNTEQSCFENVADALRLCGMTDKAEIEKRVIAALENVGMDKYKSRTPDTLSGGQQQRIAIARAIVKNPHIILADEPTGNLDEANTVMIMDLLKAISKDRLVVLVTHEANLVDFYCDRVIELSDGKLVSIKNNSNANGFTARNKNAIYLGEFEKTEISDNNTKVEYYGKAPESPVKLQIINNNGKIYLKVDSANVHILDATSEISVIDGVYKESSNTEAHATVDMTSLPPVEGTVFGKLFSFRSSVKSGYKANFKNQKRSKRLLRRCMMIFATVTVIMSAVFGKSIESFLDIEKSYNHNVFYVYSNDSAVSEKLNSQEARENGINYVQLMHSIPRGDKRIRLQTDFFETFTHYSYNTFATNAVVLDTSALNGEKTVCGNTENIKDDEMILTTAVADAFLETSQFGHITEYRDLVGLHSTSFVISGKAVRVAGIVESSETAVYLSPMAMARYTMASSGINARPGSDHGYEIKDSEATAFIVNSDVEFPKKGETIKIGGNDFVITDTSVVYASYDEYTKNLGIEKKPIEEYKDVIDPDFSHDPKVDESMTVQWHKYYFSEFDDFIESYYSKNKQDLLLWLYFEKDIEECKYLFSSNEYYYKIYAYEQKYGKTPTDKELAAEFEILPNMDVKREEYRWMYEKEFYSNIDQYAIHTNCYLVSDNDYIKLAKKTGQTHPSATLGGYGDKEMYYEYTDEFGNVYISDAMTDSSDMYSRTYTVVHSTDPDLTDSWIRSNFSNIEVPHEFMEAVITPSDVFDDNMESMKSSILSGLITMAVALVLLSVCMYFIMRSALMNRIKEVGIYRAIGVSKKNLTYKFFIESLVLSSLTVFIGYALSSLFIFVCHSLSAVSSSVFYYPLWLALADLVILLGLCVVCGIIPILLLLRKTPAQILAQYDI